jgi:hypothetical protein
MKIDIRILATVLFVVGILWSARTSGDYDFSPVFKLPFVIISYLLFWVVWLALR